MIGIDEAQDWILKFIILPFCDLISGMRKEGENTVYFNPRCWLHLKIQCIKKILISFDLHCSNFLPFKPTQSFFFLFPNGFTLLNLPPVQPCVRQFCLAFFWNGLKENKTLVSAFQSLVVIFSSVMKFKTHKRQFLFPVDVPLLCSDVIFIAMWVKIAVSCSIALLYWYRASTYVGETFSCWLTAQRWVPGKLATRGCLSPESCPGS